MLVKNAVVVGLGLFASGISYSALQAGGGAGGSAGVYSAAQAQRGKATYTARCASCHGPDLEGVEPAPPLAAPEFLANYSGKPLAVLFDKVQKTMPADKPGSLTPAETADILAYILSANKFPAGTALPSDADSLGKLQLPKRSAP